jgi:hypothetical protein
MNNYIYPVQPCILKCHSLTTVNTPDKTSCITKREVPSTTALFNKQNHINKSSTKRRAGEQKTYNSGRYCTVQQRTDNYN